MSMDKLAHLKFDMKNNKNLLSKCPVCERFLDLYKTPNHRVKGVIHTCPIYQSSCYIFILKKLLPDYRPVKLLHPSQHDTSSSNHFET